MNSYTSTESYAREILSEFFARVIPTESYARVIPTESYVVLPPAEFHAREKVEQKRSVFVWHIEDWTTSVEDHWASGADSGNFDAGEVDNPESTLLPKDESLENFKLSFLNSIDTDEFRRILDQILDRARIINFSPNDTTPLQFLISKDRFNENSKTNLLNKVEEFSHLKPGWGETDSIPPNTNAISQARKFIDLLPAGADLPQISVAEDGEVIFFWRSDSAYVDVGLWGDDEIYYYAHVENAGIDVDGSELFSAQSLPKELINAIEQV